MPLFMVKIREPSNALDPDEFLSVFINAASRRLKRVVIRNPKFSITTAYARSKPDFIGADQREEALVGHGIHVADNQEPFVVLNELRDVFPKQGERRISDNYVRLLQDVDALLTPKVSVAFQFRHAYVFDIRNAVAITEPVILKHDRSFIIMPREQVGTPILVASRYELLEAEMLEVVREVADSRIIAVAVDNLAPEMVVVMLHFLLNVRQLRIEFIFLGSRRRSQISVLHDRAPLGSPLSAIRSR